MAHLPELGKIQAMHPIALLILMLALFLAGCASAPTPPEPTPGILAGTSTTTAPPVPAATHTPSVTPTPANTPAPSITPTPTPIAALAPWARYAEALRPAAWQAFDPAVNPAAFKLLSNMTTYSLTVTLAPDLSRLSGMARIGYTNQTTTLDAIYLHLFPNLWRAGMTVGDVQVAGKPVTPTLQSNASILKVPPATPLAPGAATALTITYASPILPGEGAGNYGEFSLDRGSLALGHSYPSVVAFDTAWRLERPAEQGDVTFHDAAFYDVALTGPATSAASAWYKGGCLT